MKKVYRDILKELNKGNLVLVDVRGENGLSDRFRLIEGKECIFDFIYTSDETGFVRSCFTNIKHDDWTSTIYFRLPKSTKELVLEMEKYDESCELKIKDFMVLK
jgi:hypothetical protein